VEAPPPATHDLLVHIEPRRDLPVGVTLGGVEHQPGPPNLPERQRVAGRAVLKLRTLVTADSIS
jgi:hypothetical protein